MHHTRFAGLTLATAWAISSLFCGGCGDGQQKNWKVTVPVKGRVLVDGAPGNVLAVECTSLTGMDKANPTVSTGMTDDDGNFTLSTYVAGDGVPEGEYALTFQWGKMTNPYKPNSYAGDKLKGRYKDAKKSEIKFTAKKGEPVDLGEIKLSTK